MGCDGGGGTSVSDARHHRLARRNADAWIAVGLALLTVLVVGMSAQSLGFTRDEGYYFKAAEQYWRWYEVLGRGLVEGEPLRAFSSDVIDRNWSYNHEHPALMKTLFAWGFGFRELTGFPAGAYNAIRFPAWCMAGLSVALVFALARTLLSRRAAVVAAVMWAAMPHVFWHMHVACFDVPVVAAHTWLVLAWVRWRRTAKGALVIGVLFGLAAAVKHNVLPVPALFVLHWLLTEARVDATGASTSRGFTLPKIPLALFSLALVGPLVFIATWPWLWPDPFVRIGGYIGFHLRHEHYPILYFGELLTHPPFPIHFPFVMSAVTIPVPILVAMMVGFVLAAVVAARLLWGRFVAPMAELENSRVPLGDVVREPSGSPALLLAMNAIYPFVLIALPSTPIFGGTKHWMNGLPFLCVLAAWALEEGFARLAAAGVRSHAAAFAVVASLAVVPGVWISARVWPYGLGSYNELIGFTRGAANVGMQRTFWGYEPLEALPLINAKTPRNGRIHFGDTNNDSWRMYRRARTESPSLLREDIGWSNTVRGSAVASVQPQGEFKQQWIDVWNEWEDRTPDVVLHAEGVPVCTVTFRDRRLEWAQ